MHPDDAIRFKHHHIGGGKYVILEESSGEVVAEDLSYRAALKEADKRNKSLTDKRIKK